VRFINAAPNNAMQPTALYSMDIYEVHSRKDDRGVELISDRLPFGRLWYGETNAASNAIDYAKFRSHDVMIPVYDQAGDVIETHEHRASSTDGERKT